MHSPIRFLMLLSAALLSAGCTDVDDDDATPPGDDDATTPGDDDATTPGDDDDSTAPGDDDATPPGDDDASGDTDADEDGYTTEVDCDDQNALVYPGAPEQCNDRDDNCDGGRDEGFGYEDDFQDGALTSCQWLLSTYGSGPAIAHDQGMILAGLPASAEDDPAQSGFGASASGRCLVSGDFDIEVHFELETWPFSSGARLALAVGSHTVNRVSFGSDQDFPAYPREVYLTNLAAGTGQEQTLIETTDQAGALRLVREGELLTGYFFDASKSAWAVIDSGPVAENEPIALSYSLNLWSHAYAFTDEAIAAAFDDFVVVAGVVRCPGGG